MRLIFRVVVLIVIVAAASRVYGWFTDKGRGGPVVDAARKAVETFVVESMQDQPSPHSVGSPLTTGPLAEPAGTPATSGHGQRDREPAEQDGQRPVARPITGDMNEALLHVREAIRTLRAERPVRERLSVINAPIAEAESRLRFLRAELGNINARTTAERRRIERLPEGAAKDSALTELWRRHKAESAPAESELKALTEFVVRLNSHRSRIAGL